MASTTRTLTRTALAVVVVVGLSGVVACKRAVSFTPLPAATRSSSALGDATGTASGSALGKQTGQSPTSTAAASTSAGGAKSATGAKNGNGASAQSVAAANGSGTNTGSTATKPSRGGTTVAASGMNVRIIFWNDTTAKARPTGCEIVSGTSSYKPNTAVKFSRGSIGLAPFRKKLELTVYPTGRSGKKFVVPFTVTPDMLPNSEQDAIHVAVSDSSVRVLGNAVFNFDQIFAR